MNVRFLRQHWLNSFSIEISCKTPSSSGSYGLTWVERKLRQIRVIHIFHAVKHYIFVCSSRPNEETEIRFEYQHGTTCGVVNLVPGMA